MEVADRVMELIAREQHLDRSRVTIDSTFAELGMDSLDGVNIVFAIEEEFKLTVPDAAAKNLRTVRQMVDALTQAMSGEGASDAPKQP